jgi:hypothetical protein
MAQIKSTMEMVMARADRLCAEAVNDTGEDILQRGMKLATAWLNGEAVDLVAAINQCGPAELSPFRQGLLRTFFRHIVLPREEGQPWEGALNGLLEMAKAMPGDAAADVGQLSGLLAEIRSILSRYLQHRQQLEKQLEENFALQATQLQQSLAQQTGMKMKISPRQHPKFNEEWQRVQAQLNDQYLNALDQYKVAISGLLGL